MIPAETKPLALLVFLCAVMGEQFIVILAAFISGMLLAQRSPEATSAILDPLRAGISCIAKQARRIDVKLHHDSDTPIPRDPGQQ